MKIVYFYPSMHSAGGIERVLTVKLNYLADVLKYDIVLVNYRQRKRENFFALSQNIKQIDLELEDPIFIDKKMLSASELKKINLNFNRNLKEKIEKILFEEKANFSVSAASGKEFDFLYKIKDSSIKIVEFHFTYLVSNLYILKKNSTLLSIQGWKNYYYYKKELKKYKGYKNFIVLTEKDKNFWEKDINNVIAINNPITIFTEKKSKLDTKKIIALGRLTPQKGFDYLLKIWHKIHYKYPDWKLEIYGDGHLKEELEIQIKNLELKNCEILSPSRSVEDIYLNSSIFVLPSRFEGLPLVLMESMAFGLPSVAFDCNCGPSDLIKNEKSGFLIPPKNINLFAEKLEILMSNATLLESMGNAANQRSKDYLIDNIMKKWNNYFKQNMK